MTHSDSAIAEEAIAAVASLKDSRGNRFGAELLCQILPRCLPDRQLRIATTISAPEFEMSLRERIKCLLEERPITSVHINLLEGIRRSVGYRPYAPVICAVLRDRAAPDEALTSPRKTWAA